MTLQTVAMIIAFVLYLGLMLFLGFWGGRKTHSSEDFFLGGRQLGPWVTALSAEASDMSAWLLLGIPGLACFTGLKEAFWTIIGLAVGTYLNWLFVARRLRTYSIVAGNSITIPEFFANRFHDRTNILKGISSLLIIVFFVIYTASGFIACAKLFSTVFGMPYNIGLLLGVLIILGYTMAGGFLAVCSTDFVQGMLMFIALAVTLIAAMIHCGGWNSVMEQAASFGSQFVNPFVDSPEAPFSGMDVLGALAWGLGYFGMPHILVRFMAIRSNKDITASRRIAMIWVVIAMFVALLLGITGKIYLLPMEFATAAEAENVFMVMLMRLFPAFIAGIFLCGILAASMSTADSQLLVAASAFSKDIYKAWIRKDATEHEQLLVSRITILVISIIAIFIALDPESSVFVVVSYAWAGFGATFGPVIIFSLFWKRASRNGAVAAMIGGGLTILIWTHLSGGIFDVYELLPGFIVGSVCMVVFSLLEKNRDLSVEEEFDKYLATRIE